LRCAAFLRVRKKAFASAAQEVFSSINVLMRNIHELF
jgi:hypothetical protein